MRLTSALGRLIAIGACAALACACTPGGQREGGVERTARRDPARAEAPTAVPSRTAQEINALRPFAQAPIQPMRPFVLKAAAEDRARALDCLAQAGYY